METVELMRTYPSVRHAIAYVETFMCPTELDDGDVFAVFRGLNWNPRQVIDFMREALDDGRVSEEKGAVIPNAQARAEMDRPEFLTYVTGKMGAM